MKDDNEGSLDLVKFNDERIGENHCFKCEKLRKTGEGEKCEVHAKEIRLQFALKLVEEFLKGNK